MKKLFLAVAVLFAATTFTGCTDETDEQARELEQIEATKPGNDGTIDDEDPDDDGEG